MEQLRRLIVGLALSGSLAGCPGRPPNPHPTPPAPTPTPAPTPGPAQTPAKDVFSLSELLLRQSTPPFLDRGGVRWEPFGCIQCCAEDLAFVSKWPQANPAWMDYCGAFGANYFHFRGGPFVPAEETEWADVGGPRLPDGSDNPAYWQTVRDNAYYAGRKWKAAVQYVVVDTWGCKVDRQNPHYTGLSPDEIAACAVRPSPGIEHHIRKGVSELTCFGNVTWITGNESALVPGATQEWQNWVAGVIRDQEQKTLCSGIPVVHLLGTDDPQWASGPFDYVSTHARAPLTMVGGGHTENNERNPEFSPEQELANFCAAREKGLHWWFWNAGMNEEARSRTLTLFGRGCGGNVGCFVPPSDPPEDWEWHDRTFRSSEPAIQTAVANAQAAVGSQCGQTGPTPEQPQNVHAKQEHTIAMVASEVRKQGRCATGPWGDALAVTRTDGLVEEWHLVAFEDGCFTTNVEVRPKAYWRWLKGAAPQPPPTSSACTNPPAHAIDHFNVKEHTKGPNKTVIDSTPIVHDAAYCSSIGMQAIDCPVRQEGDPLRPVCEAEVATPVWVEMPAGASVSPENPYQLWVPRNHTGIAKVCAQQNMGACGAVQVTP